MAKTFELIAIGMSVRNADGTTYEQPPGFEIPTEEGEEALDKVLKPFEQSSFLFMFRLETTLRKRPEGLPWCIVVFDREYPLAGHFLSIRDNKSDMQFSAYSVPDDYNPTRDGVMPVSFTIFQTKDILRQMAEKTEILTSIWDELKDKSEYQYWMCIADPLPEECVEKQARNNDELFWAVIDAM